MLTTHYEYPILILSTPPYIMTHSECNTLNYSKRVTQTHVVSAVKLVTFDRDDTVSAIESVHTSLPFLSDCICRNTDATQARLALDPTLTSPVGNTGTG